MTDPAIIGHASTHPSPRSVRRTLRIWADARPQQAADALPRRLRAPRHAVALGVPADDRRVPAEDDARELRAVREVPALRLQLQRRESVSADEGVLPRRLRTAARLREAGPLVPRRFLDGGERRQPPLGRVDPAA